ncbi:hypothetical protein DRI50_01645 [candidate division KSB1 bacterium]|jgi:ribosomal protein S1|nr:MAG: hypothetical protein DRI50_01645 [candidate division KSB1 bacterium]
MTVLIIENDLSPLLKRLKKGNIVKGRIVHSLTEHHYLLRILGYNLVMKSNLKFNRFQEVLFRIQEIDDKIKLRIIDPKREFVRMDSNNKMNLLIE